MRKQGNITKFGGRLSRLRLVKLPRVPKSDRLGWNLESRRVLWRSQRTSEEPSFVRVEGLFGNTTGGRRAVFAKDKGLEVLPSTEGCKSPSGARPRVVFRLEDPACSHLASVGSGQ